MAARYVSIPALGLYTDPNPNQLPPGAMTVAQDVVIPRPGVIEPRLGTTSYSTGAGTQARQIADYASRLYTWINSSGTWLLKYTTDGNSFTSITAPATDGTFSPPNSTVDHKTVLARGNLFFTSAASVEKVNSASNQAGIAGLLTGKQPKLANYAMTSGWLANTEYIGYRILYRRDDAAGYTIRSVPSGQSRYQNTSGAFAGVTLTVPLTRLLVAGDYIEVYRTRNSTGTDPGDEHFLSYVHKITSANITAGTVTINDQTAAANLGASLYSSPSQEGAAALNYPPPSGTDLALFQGCVFTSNYTDYLRTTLALVRSAPGEWGFNAGFGGTNYGTGDFLAGRNTILNASRTTGLAVGQVITDAANPGVAGALVPANTTITNISGTTITMSANAIGTGLTQNFKVGEVVTFGVSSMYAWNDENVPVVGLGRFNANNGDTRANLQSMAYVAGQMNGALTTISVVGDTQIVVEIAGIAGTPLSVQSTNGGAWSTDISSLTTVTPSSTVNAIAWSKQDEPEHFPLTQRALVGSPTTKIQRIMATRDSLFIFKEDGAYRLTGTGPEDFRIDPFDATLHITGVESLALLDNKIYGLFDSGVERVSDYGSENISGPIQSTVRSKLAAVKTAPLNYHGWVHQTKSQYFVRLDTSTTYVWNGVAEAWTTSTLPALRGQVFSTTDEMWLGQFTGLYLLQANLYGADYAVDNPVAAGNWSGDGVSTLTITGAGFSGLTAGDVLSTTGMTAGAVVRSVTNGANQLAVVDTISAFSGHGGENMLRYAAIPVILEWAPVAFGDPGVEKAFTRANLSFDSYTGTPPRTVSYLYMTVGGRTDRTTSSTMDSERTETNPMYPGTVPFVVRRFMGRGTRIVLRVQTTEACVQWALTGWGLSYRGLGDRTRLA